MARLLASASKHSGDWLHAIPISSCGLRLDDAAIRIAVGLRLGLEICEPYTCECGAMVAVGGSYALSCKRSSGQLIRHNHLNDIIHRSLMRAGTPAAKRTFKSHENWRKTTWQTDTNTMARGPMSHLGRNCSWHYSSFIPAVDCHVRG